MRIQTSSKKKTALNLNVYRNLHHRSNNALKVKFKELAEKRLEGMPKLGRIRLHYSICPKSKRRLDIGNVGSIVDKFFSDVLTESGIIEDDDFTRLDFVSFGFGGLAKEEHVLVTITEIEERTDMKLSMTAQLSTKDLLEAAAAWVSEQTGQTATAADITLSANVTATAVLGDAPAETTTKPKTKRRTSAQVKADNEAAAAAKEAETNGDNDATVSGGSDGDSGGSGEEPETEAATETDTPAEAEVKEPKNGSPESADESSKSDDPGDSTETEEAPAPVKKKKKSSIFAGV